MSSHLIFDAHLKEALKADGDLAKGPKYQKKAKELGISLLSVNDSSMLSNRSGLLSASPRSARTPHSGSFLDGKSPGRGTTSETGTRSKSPGRCMPKLSVRAGQRTPGRKSNATTPHKQAGGDRFIPNRSTTDLERSHQLLVSSLEMSSRDTSSIDDNDVSIKQREYKERMLENLNDGVPLDNKVLSFKSKCQETKEGHVNNLKVLYSTGKTSTTKASCTRHIPSEPEKVLDAPELLNDYYLHLMDWSANNHLAVALGSSLFIWNGGDGSITSLAQFENPDHMCSLSWIKEGNVLAVGLSNTTTELWDVGQQKLIRSMGGHSDRVSTLSWNSYILSSGSRSGQIIHHDVRIPNHVTATLSDHTQDVCGLKWSRDGRLLASGGNDNLVCIYEQRGSTPIHRFVDHQAAVKGMAWSPWQNNLLATGGGTADRTIRLWNCTNGVCLKTVNTNSQVSSLLWSEHYKEIISGHGYAHNQLTLWKYPGFTKIQDLTGHSGRVLEMCLSPDGQTVVSAASDETLRLWKCWAVDKKEKKVQRNDKSHPISALARSIR